MILFRHSPWFGRHHGLILEFLKTVHKLADWCFPYYRGQIGLQWRKKSGCQNFYIARIFKILNIFSLYLIFIMYWLSLMQSILSNRKMILHLYPRHNYFKHKVILILPILCWSFWPPRFLNTLEQLFCHFRYLLNNEMLSRKQTESSNMQL